MTQREEKHIEDQIVHEVMNGIAGTEIKAGIIGEIGCSWPVTDNEYKVVVCTFVCVHPPLRGDIYSLRRR